MESEKTLWWYEFEQVEIMTRPFYVRARTLDDARRLVREHKSGSRLYMADNRRARQADIQHTLGFNSGTVSQALSALERDGEVQRLPKENRSYVWELLD